MGGRAGWRVGWSAGWLVWLAGKRSEFGWLAGWLVWLAGWLKVKEFGFDQQFRLDFSREPTLRRPPWEAQMRCWLVLGEHEAFKGDMLRSSNSPPRQGNFTVSGP